MINIRDRIVEKRRERIASLGHSEGVRVPKKREVPLNPFLPGQGMICEIKRSSPSRGIIAEGLDAVAQARAYVGSGAANLSVLTVPEGFSGSIDDLIRVKQALPGVAALRKDFLFDPEDVDVAWRAGADAVLLIAGMLSAERLAELYRKAKQYGMEALVELHDAGDVDKARAFKPSLVGVNSRDLVTFKIDPLLPLRIKALVDWPARVVYESGIHAPEQAAFAASSGFSGILVGESVVRDPTLPERLEQAMASARPDRFWPHVAGRMNRLGGKPLVKICGLAREEDARTAAEAGADLLGFVFWSKSKRRAAPELLRRLADVGTPKVGVVVDAHGPKGVGAEVRSLLEDGLLDAVQFHGGEEPEVCASLWPVYYKALRPGDAAMVNAANLYRCPRLLLDAVSPLPGGSGVRVWKDVLEIWSKPLWLAGGLKPENIVEVINQHRPELVDCASGVEAKPGVKDAARVREFIRKARHDSIA